MSEFQTIDRERGLTDARIIEIRKQTRPVNYYSLWAETLAFARAIEDEVRKEYE